MKPKELLSRFTFRFVVTDGALRFSSPLKGDNCYKCLFVLTNEMIECKRHLIKFNRIYRAKGVTIALHFLIVTTQSCQSRIRDGKFSRIKGIGSP